MPSNFTPPAFYNYSTPDIGVEIYPHNGGSSFYISGSNNNGIISAEITKNIRDRQGGKFILNLTPGGPNGVDSKVSWSQIITPNSLCVIYLSRGGAKRIVMVGLVLKIEEAQVWTHRGVRRTIRLIGMDFSYYFNNFSYYELTYLGLVANQQPEGVAGYILGQFGQIAMGPPAEQAFIWLTKVMLGSGNPNAQAVLDNTYIMYKGQKIYLREFMGYWLEAFTEAAAEVFIPFLTDLVNSEGSWFDKFLSMLPWPYYELFVITANAGDYPGLNTTNTSAPVGPSATTTSFASIPAKQIDVNNYDPVFPVLVGRVNPLPWINYTAAGTAGTLNIDRWNALNSYSLGTFGFIESHVSCDTNEVANFFGVQTIDSAAIANQAGSSNGNLFAFELIGGIIDHNSINSYGFRPKFVNTRWLTSLAPIFTSKDKLDLNFLSSVLLGKLASYYIPAPLMYKGYVSFPMWPDVMPGNKFIYKPFKNGDDYEFYIEGFTHVYEFGGNSRTMLDIDRGLKKSDYDTPANLTGLMLDTYTRINGDLAQRSDISTSAGAYYVNPETLVRLGITISPYYSAPPTIVPPSSSSP